MLLLVALLVAAGVAWGVGGAAAVPTHFARQAVERRDADDARYWIRLAERLHVSGGNAELELMKARLARRRGDVQAMDRHLERAATFGADPERVDRERVLAAAQAGQLRRVEPLLIEWLQSPGRDGAEISDAYTNGLAAQGRLPEAQAFLDAWEADYPDDPEPHLRRGRIAEHALEWTKAEQEYRLALEKRPQYPPALYALARLLLDRKRPEEALPLFQRCAELAPATASAANVGTAGCLRLLGRFDEARRLLHGVLALDDAQRNEAYDRVRFHPEGDQAAFELGKLESGEGNYQAAEKWLQQAVSANPRDLEARYALGVALQRLGRSEEAQRELEHVSRVRQELAEVDKLHDRLSKDPADVEARYGIGVAYLEHRSPRAGAYWLQSALTHDPDYAPAHRALADYYASRSDESRSYADLAEYHRDRAERSNDGTDEN